MKTITQITPQKKNPKRCNIFLDGEFFCGMELMTVMKNRLKEGQKVAEREIENLVMESESEAAWQAALGYVSSTVHTAAQVRAYLKKKGFISEAAEQAIKKLKDYGFIDDAAYSRIFVSERKNAKGKRLMKYELKAKGVDEAAIDEALEAVSEDEGAYLTAAKFMKSKEPTFENFAKCYRRLVSKGFDYDVAKSAVDKVKGEYGSSED